MGLFKKKKLQEEKRYIGKVSKNYRFKSKKAASVLTFILVLIALYMGLQGVFGDKISAYKAKEILNRGGVLIDISSETLYEKGHIMGAENVPYDKLKESGLEYDHEKNIVICGRNGIRTSKAVKYLRSLGYKNVYDLGSLDSFR
ncbi:rhodanese-like domain-containing protein [Peptoniphilus sp. GNH]|nr:rhodanese-like domain-containing protein [Peptoniphilus sp. GNH]